MTLPQRCGSRRLVWPKGEPFGPSHGPKPQPPFFLVSAKSLGSARSSPGREAAKRPLTARTDLGSYKGEGKGGNRYREVAPDPRPAVESISWTSSEGFCHEKERDEIENIHLGLPKSD